MEILLGSYWRVLGRYWGDNWRLLERLFWIGFIGEIFFEEIIGENYWRNYWIDIGEYWGDLERIGKNWGNREMKRLR